MHSYVCFQDVYVTVITFATWQTAVKHAEYGKYRHLCLTRNPFALRRGLSDSKKKSAMKYVSQIPDYNHPAL